MIQDERLSQRKKNQETMRIFASSISKNQPRDVYMDEGKGEERVRRRNAILLNLFLSQLFPFRSSYLTAPHRARPQAGRQGKKRLGRVTAPCPKEG